MRSILAWPPQAIDRQHHTVHPLCAQGVTWGDSAIQVDHFKREVPPDPAAPPPEEGEEPEYILPVEVEGDMGDVISDFKLLHRAGIGFGKPASMRLYLAMKKLLHKNIGAQEGEKIVRVRSWGKVLGLNNDYLVAECVMEGRQPMPAVPEGLPASVVPPDPVGTEFADYLTSANHFVYYVTHAPRNYSHPLSPYHPDPIIPNHHPVAAPLPRCRTSASHCFLTNHIPSHTSLSS